MSKFLQSIQDRAAAFVLRQPAPRLQRMFGLPPHNTRGDVLEVRLHALMRLISLSGEGGLYRHDVPQARDTYARATRVMSGDEPALPVEKEICFDGPHGPIKAVLYRPDVEERLPACVFFHGGGFTVGSVASYASVARRLARRTHGAVISVEYRLAPEHPFPASYDEAFAAFTQSMERAAELGIDRERVWVAGDSAGAALAIGVTHMCIQREVMAPACQLLFYPVAEVHAQTASREEFAEGYFLTRGDLDYFEGHHGAGRGALAPPVSLESLPPTVVVIAGFDPLRDEGEAYAASLREAGVEVRMLYCSTLVHGFLTMEAWVPEVVEYIEQAITCVQAMPGRHQK